VNFGEAFHDLQNGFLLRRDAWLSAAYVVVRRGYPDGIPINADTAKATGLEEGDVRIFRPYLMMCGMDGAFSMWVPSVGDLFAEDWRLYTRQPVTDNPTPALGDVARHTFTDPEGKQAG
jgi:hypothetical protein